ncbi:MAG: GNAT family N-acetyltransferase [Candidatus Bathyarchaeia archaeon]
MSFEIHVREMLNSERTDVLELFKNNLGVIDQLFFQLAFKDSLKNLSKQQGTVLVAICNKVIVGTVSLRVVIFSNKRIGLIDAIVIERSFRGRGVGKILVDKALSWFEERECNIICVTADRFNSPSWNMFIHKGFSPYEIIAQYKDLGWNFIRLWISEFYIFGSQTFFLKKTGETDIPAESGEVRHFLVGVLGLALIWLILGFRQGESFTIFPFVFGAAGLSLFVHELGHKIAARHFNIKTTFKAWDSGILFSSFLAIFGILYPSYGSTYIKHLDWNYHFRQKETGIIYSAGLAMSLILAILFWASLKCIYNEALTVFGRMCFATNLYIAIFNLIPIQASGGFAWDGTKILRWNKYVWLLLAVGTIILLLADLFLK